VQVGAAVVNTPSSRSWRAGAPRFRRVGDRLEHEQARTPSRSGRKNDAQPARFLAADDLARACARRCQPMGVTWATQAPPCVEEQRVENVFAMPPEASRPRCMRLSARASTRCGVTKRRRGPAPTGRRRRRSPPRVEPVCGVRVRGEVLRNRLRVDAAEAGSVRRDGHHSGLVPWRSPRASPLLRASRRSHGARLMASDPPGPRASHTPCEVGRNGSSARAEGRREQAIASYVAGIALPQRLLTFTRSIRPGCAKRSPQAHAEPRVATCQAHGSARPDRKEHLNWLAGSAPWRPARRRKRVSTKTSWIAVFRVRVRDQRPAPPRGQALERGRAQRPPAVVPKERCSSWGRDFRAGDRGRSRITGQCG
jgi:hypothetical protein